jgi:hypothetical protein
MPSGESGFELPPEAVPEIYVRNIGVLEQWSNEKSIDKPVPKKER